MTRRSLLLASLVAPLSAVALYAAVMLVRASAERDSGDIVAALLGLSVGPIIAYAMAWLVALPVVWLLYRAQALSLRSILAVGVVAGLLVIPLVKFCGVHLPPASKLGEALRVLLSAVEGGVAAWIWWWLATRAPSTENDRDA